MSTPAIQKVRATLAPLVKAPLPADDDASLFELGVLDSFALMEAIGRLEETFGISVPDADLNPRRFETLAKIARYFEARRAA